MFESISWQLRISIYIIVKTVFNCNPQGGVLIWKERTNQINVNTAKFMGSVPAWAQKTDVVFLQLVVVKEEKYYLPRPLTISVVFF